MNANQIRFFVVICEDCHIDPFARLFTTKEKAEQFAERYMIQAGPDCENSTRARVLPVDLDSERPAR